MNEKKDRYDLHIHSNFSDGDLSPIEILKIAKEKKLKGISITDHDTIAAYNETVLKEAARLQIELIVGIEISSIHENENVHVLGYNFDLADSSLHEFLQEVRKRRRERNEIILNKLKENGIEIAKQEVNSTFPFSAIGRMHIAKIMQKKGYVSSVKEAFDKYLKDKGPCYVRGEKFSSLEVIKIIQKAKGKAILAHPHLLHSSHLLTSLLKLPFDGMEVFYGVKPTKEEKKYLDIALEKKWLITGGSDFHGEAKPFIKIGSSWIDSENLKKLMS